LRGNNLWLANVAPFESAMRILFSDIK